MLSDKKERKKERKAGKRDKSSRRGKAAILYVMSMRISREDLSSSGNNKCKGPEARLLDAIKEQHGSQRAEAEET